MYAFWDYNLKWDKKLDIKECMEYDCMLPFKMKSKGKQGVFNDGVGNQGRGHAWARHSDWR